MPPTSGFGIPVFYVTCMLNLSEECFYKCGFARSVLAYNLGYCSAVNMKIDIFKDCLTAKAYPKILNLNTTQAASVRSVNLLDYIHVAASLSNSILDLMALIYESLS